MQEKNQTAPPQRSAAATPPRRRRFWRWLRWAAYVFLLLLCCMLAAAGWLCRSQGGQAWLEGKLNTVLAEALGPSGLHIRLHGLSGPLPLGASFGLELADAHGVWLRAPQNSFYLDLFALPSLLRLDHLEIREASLLRLPQLPQSPPAPPSPPLTEADVRLLLGDVVRTSNALPDWLPAVELASLRLQDCTLPVGLFLPVEGESTDTKTDEASTAAIPLDFAASLHWDHAQGAQLKADLQLADKGTDLPLSIASLAGLTAGLNVQLVPQHMATGQPGAQEQAASPLPAGQTRLAADIQLDVTAHKPLLHLPDLPADLLGQTARLELRAGASLTADAEGPLQTASLGLDALKLEAGALSSTTSLHWQQGQENWLDGPVRLSQDLLLHRPATASADQTAPLLVLLAQPCRLKLALDGSLFLPHLQLDLAAAGLESTGELTAALADMARPALDGFVRLQVADWQTLSRLVPGKVMTGKAGLTLELRALQTLAEGQGPGTQQNMALRLDVPQLRLAPSDGDDLLDLHGLHLTADMANCLDAPSLDARLGLGSSRIAAMPLAAQAHVRGPLAGPLEFGLNSSGAVTAAMQGQWQPGLAEIRQLALDLAGLLPQPENGIADKPAALGLRLTSPTRVLYGETGYAVEGLRAAITPSGQLAADGRLAASGPNLQLSLRQLEFAPWRSLVPALPEGALELTARLGGTATRPDGQWRLAVQHLKLDGSPLPPLDVALAGQLEHTTSGSALTARLELPPATLKALGGKTARLEARVPLLFGPDGLPAPALQKPLRASVAWHGALAQLWSLVPQADRRLTGNLDLGLDVSGTLEAPAFKGQVGMSKGRFEDVALGVLLQDMKLDMHVDGKKIASSDATKLPLAGGLRLDMSLGDGRGGSLKVQGGGKLDGSALRMQAKMDRLKPLRRRDVRIDLSGDASVSGSLVAPEIRGEIRVNRGDVYLNKISVPGSFTTLPISEGDGNGAADSPDQPASSATASASDDTGHGSLDIRIRAPGRIMVEGHGLSSQWQTFLAIGGSPVDPVISGQVRAIKGNFDFLTKKFVLSRGIVTFGGGNVANPLLDVQLVNEMPDLTAQINVTGTVRKMKIELASEPSLPRDEILSRILFGRSANELGRMESLRLAAAVAELAGLGSGGGGLLDSTRRALGVDVLRLGDSASGASGDPGSQTEDGTTLEMGKYLTEDLYLGVEQGMQSDSTAFTIQYELTPRINLEVRTEDSNTWGGVRWKFDY